TRRTTEWASDRRCDGLPPARAGGSRRERSGQPRAASARGGIDPGRHVRARCRHDSRYRSMLTLTGLTKTFGGHRVLDSLDRELESCGLTALAERNVGQLSGGERQRLAMAVAFLPTVDLYLFDEASASLDPGASRILFRRAKQLQRDGHTLLFTTHTAADV